MRKIAPRAHRPPYRAVQTLNRIGRVDSPPDRLPVRPQDPVLPYYARRRRDQGIDPQLLFPSGRVPPAALLLLALVGGNRRGKLQEVQLARIL